MNFKARTLKKNSFIVGFGRGAQVGEASFLEVKLRPKRRRWRIIFIWYASGPGISPTLVFGRRRSVLFTMRSKIVRRLPSWQRSGVVSQQRLRFRRLTLVKHVPNLRFEHVSNPIFSLFFQTFESHLRVTRRNFKTKLQAEISDGIENFLAENQATCNHHT